MRLRYGFLAVILVLLATTASAQGSWPNTPGPFELTFDSAITRAMDISPNLELAELEAEKARLEFRAQARMTREIGEVSTYQGAVIKYLHPEQGRLAVQLAEDRLEGVRANVALTVRTAYLGAILAREMVMVAQEAVTMVEEQVRLAQRLYQSGMVPRKDVLDASVRQAEAEVALISAEKELALATMGLARVIGLPLDAEIQLEPAVTLLDISDYPLPQQVDRGLERRFELKQSLNAVKLAHLNHSLAQEYPAQTDWAQLWPEELPVPPWLPGHQEGQQGDEELDEINQRQAEIEYQQAIIYHLLNKDEIQMQIRDAYLSVEEASQRLVVSEAGLIAAEEGLRLAQLRYQAGMGTNQEVLSAQLARSQAHTALVAALFEHELAKAVYLHSGSAGFADSGATTGRR